MSKTPRLSCVTFPVLPYDVGIEKAMEEIADIGFHHVMFCCGIYTGYRLVMPRNPVRPIYALEEGLQYHRPDEAHYGSIKPRYTSDFGDRDLLGEAVEHARSRGMTVGAWLPFFANGRIAKAHPEAALQNLYGARDRLFLCYNNPDMLEFVRGMTRDVVEGYGVDAVEVDKIPQTLLELNAFAGRLDPIVRIIGSFCFCEHCEAKAKEFGADLPAIRKHARKLVEDSLRIPPHVINRLADELQGDAEAPLLLLDEPMIHDLLRIRLETVRAFMEDLRRRVRKMRAGTRVYATFVPPFKIGHDASAPRSWLCGQSYKNVAGVVDGINAVIHWERDVVAYETRRAANAVAGRCALDVHVPAYGRFAPDETPRLAEAALENGADSVSFFCYDLMSEEMVEAVRAWIRAQKAGAK